jgi:hypothetical protein
VDYAFRRYLGRDLRNGVVVAERSKAFELRSSEETESWIARVVDGQLLVVRRARGLIRSLWVSPSGRIYTAGAGDQGPGVYVEETGDPYASRWVKTPLPMVYSGVFGLDDDFVFAWGGTPDETHLSFFDGASWHVLESPGWIQAMHGVRRDLLYAVGYDGMAAWWDGAKWNRQATTTAGIISSVYVVSEDEVYATGPCRRILAGSIYGWTARLAVSWPVFDLTKWTDGVFVAAGGIGLAKVDGNSIDVVRRDVKADRVIAGDSLLVVTENALSETSDLTTFTAIPIEDMAAFMDQVRPPWNG